MTTLIRNLRNIYRQYHLRKEYRKLRLEALDALRSGDIKRSVALDARADKMLDKVIYS